MKGQVSIEFMTLLALALLGSTLLLNVLDRKASAYNSEKQFDRSEQLASKTNYVLSYVEAHKNSTIDLGFTNDLDRVYVIEIDSNTTVVESPNNRFTFNSWYEGSHNFTLNTSNSYQVSGGGEVSLE